VGASWTVRGEVGIQRQARCVKRLIRSLEERLVYSGQFASAGGRFGSVDAFVSKIQVALLLSTCLGVRSVRLLKGGAPLFFAPRRVVVGSC